MQSEQTNPSFSQTTVPPPKQQQTTTNSQLIQPQVPPPMPSEAQKLAQLQNTCKICLTQISLSSQSDNPAISPCLCTGSMKYVHEECLRMWLNAIVNKNLEHGMDTYNNISCEICKNKYTYEIQETWTVASCKQTKQRIDQNRMPIVSGLFFIILSIFGIIQIGIVSGEGRLKLNNEDSGYTVFVICCIMLLIIIILWLYRLFQMYMLKYVNIVGEVYNMKAQSQDQPSINFLNLTSV